MGRFSDFQESKLLKPQQDSLRIDLREQKLRGNLSSFRFIDKDTNQCMFYIPSLEISGYGTDYNQAMEMAKFSIDQYFEYLFSLSQRMLQIEFTKLGWKKNTFRNKEFSKAFIDINGELKNFNALENKIERVTLVA